MHVVISEVSLNKCTVKKKKRTHIDKVLHFYDGKPPVPVL